MLDTNNDPGLWRDGWYRHAQACPSPNFGPRPGTHPTDLIIIHSISLPPGVYGGPEIEALFTNRLDFDAHPYFQQIRDLRVSAHFVIRRGGELIQFVPCAQRAWHAGVSCWRERERCNDFSVGIELEGADDTLYAPAQYQRLQTLIEALRARYPIADVVGHSDIAPGRKTDPGPAFIWSEIKIK